VAGFSDGTCCNRELAQPLLADVIALEQGCSTLELVGRRLPFHIEDLILGRSCFSGASWQSRHQRMKRECAFQVSGIWLTPPWQLEQPMPFWT